MAKTNGNYRMIQILQLLMGHRFGGNTFEYLLELYHIQFPMNCTSTLDERGMCDFMWA